MMNEYYVGYLESMKALNKSFVQTTDKLNEESDKSSDNVSSYYITYLEAWQKMTQQWINAVWAHILEVLKCKKIGFSKLRYYCNRI